MHCKMYKTELFWVVRDHPSLSAMSPFDRGHTTSYSSNRKYMSILYRLRDIILDRSIIALSLPIVFNAPGGGVPLGQSEDGQGTVVKKYCQKVQLPE